MRILHVIPSVSPLTGGPSAALHALTRALAVLGLDVDVATTDDHGALRLDVPLGKPLEWDGVRYLFFHRQIRFYTVSTALLAWFAQRARDYDIVHIHALFSFTSVGVAAIARTTGRPYVLQPHGSLGTWGFYRSRPRLKRLSFLCVERPLIRSAASLYLNSDLEAEEAQQIGATRQPDIVPYAMTLPDFDRAGFAERFRCSYPQFQSKTIILFLSRLHAKKGLDVLLDAFQKIRMERPKAILAVVGDGDPEYLKQLKRRVEAASLQESVLFLGFLSGEMKWAAITAADLFVLPSQSESFGIAVIEAMWAGTPVVVTREAAVSSFVEREGGGAVAECTSESLSLTIVKLLEDKSALRQLGAQARAAAALYSSDVVARETMDLYQRLIHPR